MPSRRPSRRPPIAAGSQPPGPEAAAQPPTPGRPIPTAPIPTEAERAEQRLRERADAVRGGHWTILLCPLGHESQRHRTSPMPQDGFVPCPICHQACRVEAPDETAKREHSAATSPMALLREAWDRLSDWAQVHLDADTWNRQSEARQAEALRRDPSRSEGATPFEL